MVSDPQSTNPWSHISYSLIVPGLLWLITSWSGGCRPNESIVETSIATDIFPLQAGVQQLPPDAAKVVSRQMHELAGTPDEPRLVGVPGFDSQRLASSLRLYRRHCGSCHGTSGGGDGLWSAMLPVAPRDFRKGVFKFQSTPYGARPIREDLRRTITRGIEASLMPGFHRLPPDEREQLAIAVELLARRGELETRLVLEAETSGDPPDDEELQEIANDIRTAWSDAGALVLVPLTHQPEFTAEMVERGRLKFLQKGCAKCHGEDGRGQTEQNLQGGLRDIWGHPVQAADLTSGRLKGGSEPIDIYRRILGGINGTPMPSFRAILWAEPESVWDLVAWVRHVGRHDRSAERKTAEE